MSPVVRFHLGTHCAGWLWAEQPARWPWFVSHRRLARYKTLRPATADWALDSGGFTELSMFGGWRTTPAEYVTAVRRYRDEIGRLAWAAPQDWMCEPQMLERTGLTVAEHQALTVANLLELRTLDATLPIVPVLQGWQRDDYLRHVDAYLAAGIDVTTEQLVGMGTFCRRARLAPVASLVAELHAEGVAMHAFGIKADGMARYGWALHSADSMAWSYYARREPGRMCGTEHRAVKCANCRLWAETWAAQATADTCGGPVQMTLAGVG